MHNNIKNIVLLSIIFFFLSCSLAFGWVSNRIPVKDRTDDPTFATGRSYYYSKSNVPYFIDGAGVSEQLGGGATAFTLPTVDGNNLEVLVTDGAGVLSWGVQSGGGGGSGGATGYGSDEAGIQIPTGISEFWIVGAGGIKTKVTQSPTTGVTYYLYPAGTTVYGTDGSLVSGASNIWIVNDPTGTSVTVVSDGTGGATVYVGVASGVSVFDSYGGSFINQRTVHISGHTGFVVEVQGTSGLSLFPIEALPVTAKVNEAAGIDDGNVVYINGATGPFPQVGLADKDDPDGSHIIGIATETKTNGQSILIGLVGLVSGVSTSAYTAGDHMYLQNNGDWSNVPPTVGNVVHFGVVVYSHAINGKVLLRMHHVHVHSMALGETEVYRIPAGSKYSWVEEADSSNTPFEVSPSGVSATNINVSGGVTSGYVHTKTDQDDESGVTVETSSDAVGYAIQTASNTWRMFGDDNDGGDLFFTKNGQKCLEVTYGAGGDSGVVIESPGNITAALNISGATFYSYHATEVGGIYLYTTFPGGNYTLIKPHGLQAVDLEFTLPQTGGATKYVLTTDGHGQTNWNPFGKIIDFGSDSGATISGSSAFVVSANFLNPDDANSGVSDNIAIFRVNPDKYPDGIILDSIMTQQFGTTGYAVNVEEWNSDDNPSMDATIELMTIAGGTYVEETRGANIDDRNIAAGHWIFVDLPTTETDQFFIEIKGRIR